MLKDVLLVSCKTPDSEMQLSRADDMFIVDLLTYLCSGKAYERQGEIFIRTISALNHQTETYQPLQTVPPMGVICKFQQPCKIYRKLRAGIEELREKNRSRAEKYHL